LEPSLASGDDVVGIGASGKGLGVFVVLCNDAVDGGLEIGDGSENSPLQAPTGEFGQETFHGVQPEMDLGAKWHVQRGGRSGQRRTSDV